MSSLRVAIVGCGIISRQHIEAFARNAERSDIVIFCDTDRTKAEEGLEIYRQALGREPAARIVTDYQEVLADPEVGAVILLLPHHLHKDMSNAAARAGKHILCEKPLALTPEDCDSMAATAKEAGVVLYHGENMRVSRTVERGAELIREGRLGTVVGLQATYAQWQSIDLNRDWRTNPVQSGGGHLMDAAVHWVDMLRHLGGDITAVQAMATTFRPELGAQSEDTGVLNFRYAGGHLGQLFACHASRGRGASCAISVFGTEGCLSLDAFVPDHALTLFPKGKPEEVIIPRQHWQETFVRQAAHFIEVVLDGVPLKATPEDGKANVKVILAAYESIRTGREIEVG